MSFDESSIVSAFTYRSDAEEIWYFPSDCQPDTGCVRSDSLVNEVYGNLTAM